MPSKVLAETGRQLAERALSVVPILIALATLFVSAMQQSNGLPLTTTVQTLLLGWVLLTPTAALLLWPTPEFVPDLGIGLGRKADTTESAEGPAQRLRDRYARGELSETEFERKLERLLETEDVSPGEIAEPERDLEHELE